MKNTKPVLGKVLDIDPAKINDLTGPGNTDAWDSFNGLFLVTELEKNFNVKFTIDEIVGVKSVGDIKGVLTKHGVKFE